MCATLGLSCVLLTCRWQVDSRLWGLCVDGSLISVARGTNSNALQCALALDARDGGGGVALCALPGGALVAVCLVSRLELHAANGSGVVASAEHINARAMVADAVECCVYVCCAGDNSVLRHRWLPLERRIETVRFPTLHRAPLVSIARGSTTVTVADDGSVGLWNARDESIAVVDAPRSSRITCCVAGGNTVYFGTKSGDVLCCVVRGPHMQLVGQLGPSHERGPVRQLVIVGQRLVSVGASDMRIFDLMTFECVVRFLSDERRTQHDGFQCACVSGARTLCAASGRTLFNCDGAGAYLCPTLEELCVMRLRDTNSAVPDNVGNKFQRSQPLFAQAARK